MWPLLAPFLHISFKQSINKSINQSYQSINQSIIQSINWMVIQSVSQSVSFVNWSASQSVSQSCQLVSQSVSKAHYFCLAWMEFLLLCIALRVVRWTRLAVCVQHAAYIGNHLHYVHIDIVITFTLLVTVAASQCIHGHASVLKRACRGRGCRCVHSTVKPVWNVHPWCHKNVVFRDTWSSQTGLFAWIPLQETFSLIGNWPFQTGWSFQKGSLQICFTLCASLFIHVHVHD